MSPPLAELAEDAAERFLRYVRVDTQSEEDVERFPSTEKQLDLLRLLHDELAGLGLEVELDRHGYVFATVPATVDRDVPTIGFLAHVDTSPAVSGANVKPQRLRYEGGEIVLPGDPSQVIGPDESEELAKHVGHELITTDGTTLLGADDKAGVAEIMAAVAHLVAHPEVPHGTLRIGFNPDEEVGTGTRHFDIERFGAVAAYTLDGSTAGELQDETFSAVRVTMTIRGRAIHPGTAKGELVNAVKILSAVIERLPKETLSPETTEGREGFVHPNEIVGDASAARGQVHRPRLRRRRARAPRRAAAADRRRGDRGRAEGEHRDRDPRPVPQHAHRALRASGDRRQCRGGAPPGRARADPDADPRRHRRLAADREGPADAEPLHRRPARPQRARVDLRRGHGSRGADRGRAREGLGGSLAVETTRLDGTELELSRVGLGCNNFGRAVDLEGTRRVVDAALDAGVTHFDTADIYGNKGDSERFLGELLEGRRDRVVLATKFGMDMGDGVEARGAPDYVRRRCDESLRRLRTDRIDLYYYHSPRRGDADRGDARRALSELVDAGKVRYVACSNFTGEQLREAEAAARERGLHRFVALQNEYNLIEREAEEDALPAARELDVGFVPYFPLASGLLTGKYSRDEPAPEGTRLHGRDAPAPETWDRVEALERFAAEHGRSLLELAIAALASEPGVASVICGATKPEQVQANAAAAGWRLSADELARLRRL